MIKQYLQTVLVLALAVVLQTTLVHHIAIFDVKPDLTLILLVLFSVRRGAWIGQTSGFTAGLLEDFLSLSPLGFHSFIKTLTGYLYGNIHGKIYIDPIFFPLLFVLTASLLKGLLTLLLILIFQVSLSFEGYFSWRFWLETGYNLVLTPFLFFLYRLMEGILDKRGKSYS